MGIKSLRKAKGMTAMQLSAICGIPQPTISRIERGVNIPRSDTALMLAKALGCTIEQLIEPDPAEQEQQGA